MSWYYWSPLTGDSRRSLCEETRSDYPKSSSFFTQSSTQTLVPAWSSTGRITSGWSSVSSRSPRRGPSCRKSFLCSREDLPPLVNLLLSVPPVPTFTVFGPRDDDSVFPLPLSSSGPLKDVPLVGRARKGGRKVSV